MNHGWSLPFFSKTSCFFLGHYYFFSCLPSVLSQCRVYTDLPSCNSSFFVTPQILFFKVQFKVKHSLSNFLGHSYIKQEVRSVLPTLGFKASWSFLGGSLCGLVQFVPILQWIVSSVQAGTLTPETSWGSGQSSCSLLQPDCTPRAALQPVVSGLRINSWDTGVA